MKDRLRKDFKIIKGLTARTVIAAIVGFVVHYILHIGGVVTSPSRYGWSWSHHGTREGYGVLIGLFIFFWIGLYLLEVWLYGNEEPNKENVEK